MAHISTGVEYGLHCLLYLVSSPETPRTASVRDLAELQGVPIEYVAKVFTRLQKAGLVVAAEGARGGFCLARAPHNISVWDVVRAIDGDKSLFECRETRGRCAAFGNDFPRPRSRGVCSIHAIMIEAEQRMRDALSAHTVADIAASVTAKTPSGYDQRIAEWLDNRATTPRRLTSTETRRETGETS